MKLASLPARADLDLAYETLQIAGRQPTTRELVLWSRWSRLDPRLAQILVRHFAERFRAIDALALREGNLEKPCPQALLALAEFSGLASNPSDRGSFAAWLACLSLNVEPAPAQAFFVREGRLRPEADLVTAQESLSPYLKWGFFGNVDLADAGMRRRARPLGPTRMPKPARRALIDRLLQETDRLTVRDYLQACHGLVHRRTAERDLGSHPGLRAVGQTRARSYVRKKPGL